MAGAGKELGRGKRQRGAAAYRDLPEREFSRMCREGVEAGEAQVPLLASYRGSSVATEQAKGQQGGHAHVAGKQRRVTRQAAADGHGAAAANVGGAEAAPAAAGKAEPAVGATAEKRKRGHRHGLELAADTVAAAMPQGAVPADKVQVPAPGEGAQGKRRRLARRAAAAAPDRRRSQPDPKCMRGRAHSDKENVAGGSDVR